MARTSLPPGFRFHPTDIEIVCYYLKRKVMGKSFHFDAIAEVDLYKFAPWDLPEKSQMYSKDLEWYFLCPRDRKYPNGSRANRTTDIGYWKATGKDRSVEYESRTIGMKKTLIFHVGKPPKGDRTDWVMYEYRLEDKEVTDAGFSKDAYVLCKIFQKSGLGPKIGEQYGAPFNEADWDDETGDVVSLPFLSCSTSKVLPDPASSAPVLHQPITSNVIENPLDPDLSGIDGLTMDSSAAVLLQPPTISNVIEDPSDPELSGIDGLTMDDLVDLMRSPIENTNEKISDSLLNYEDNNASSILDYEVMYRELESLSAQTVMSETNSLVADIQFEYPIDYMLAELCSDQYMELNDLSFLGDTDMCIKGDCLLEQHAPDQSMFEQHPSEHVPSLHYLNNIPLCNADTTSASGPFWQESGFNASSPCLQENFCDIWNY